ncbi:oxidoreductase [Aspergillus coremiiformis]|uniref:mRNA N(6)-methyladenine demethylase n=1 Tax=Aspergillus coremiiformis TaxID=138285 RepID=A0A5N6Z7S9_9EURO|nr:oxidoreductase [Aspergillus coremiiformis]
MAHIKELNAHERPPEAIRHRYKEIQKATLSEIELDKKIIDLQAIDPDKLPSGISLAQWMSGEQVQPGFHQFVRAYKGNQEHGDPSNKDIPVYTHRSVSGLQMIPSLLPPAVQIELLSRLLHRDLSNMEHQTNLHLHYNITYPGQAGNSPTKCDNISEGSDVLSFFEDNPARVIYPKDPDVHKPLTVQQILNRKLRWATLGGQYNWTTKEYPMERPPAFPDDVANVLHAAFPQTEAQAAIVNFYSPRDTLSPHRDVSEECDVGLISVSFGCDGLFLISHDDGKGCEIVRLRSGDAVYMDGTSRFAWHAVPRIIPGTCPEWLADWPGSCAVDDPDASKYDRWKGWMSGKRVNLNIRQMTVMNTQS